MICDTKCISKLKRGEEMETVKIAVDILEGVLSFSEE